MHIYLKLYSCKGNDAVGYHMDPIFLPHAEALLVGSDVAMQSVEAGLGIWTLPDQSGS